MDHSQQHRNAHCLDLPLLLLLVEEDTPPMHNPLLLAVDDHQEEVHDSISMDDNYSMTAWVPESCSDVQLVSHSCFTTTASSNDKHPYLAYEGRLKEACCVCGGGIKLDKSISIVNRHRIHLLRKVRAESPGMNIQVKMTICFIGGVVFLIVVLVACLKVLKRRERRIERRYDVRPGNTIIDEDGDDDDAIRSSTNNIPAERKVFILNHIVHKTVLSDEEDSGQAILPDRTIAIVSCNLCNNVDKTGIVTENDRCGKENRHQVYDLGRTDTIVPVTTSHRKKKRNVFLKKNNGHSFSSHEYSASIYSSTFCAICVQDYTKGDKIAWSRNEKCHHAFHLHCIVEWLQLNGDECPLCRINYLDLESSGDV